MTNRSCFRSSVFILVAAIGFASAARAAAPLADHVPDDAVLYVGWAGADSQLPAYQASDLSAFIDHSNLPDLIKQYLPKMWDQLVGQNNEHNKQAVAAMQKALPLLWRHATALYVANVTIRDNGSPDVNVALTCDAGVDAAELEADLQAMIQGSIPPLRVVTHNSVVTLGQAKFADAELGATLAGNPAFIAAMKKLQPSPAVAVYVDAKSIISKVDESAQADDRAAQRWPKWRDALGIAGMKTYALTAGFDGTNWMTASLLEAPAPRTGLLAAFEPRPIDPVLLARIPASAGSVSVFNVDVAKLIDTVGEVMAADPGSDREFHQGIGAATVVLGANFRKQIVGPLGPQWVLYSDPQSRSAVLMNHPNDPAVAGDSMVSAMFGLVNIANAQIPGAATQPVVNAVQASVKQVNVTSAVTKYLSPSVAVKDGVLYFGMTPESVVTSASLSANPAATDLLHSDGFLLAVKRLGVDHFDSFDYCDLPITAPRAYDNFGPAGAKLRQAMSTFGMEMPKIELPPLDEFKMHLSPALSVKWANADGVYTKSISPFPCSTKLLGDPQQTMVNATTVSAISAGVMPLLQRGRQQAMGAQSMSQEHQLMLFLIMYANGHHNQLPADFGSLVAAGTVPGSGLSAFLDPSSNTTVPPEILNGTKDAQAAWVNANAAYVLLTPNRTFRDVDPSTEVIVPKNAGHGTARVPVAFIDGHVGTCTPKHAQNLLHPDN